MATYLWQATFCHVLADYKKKGCFPHFWTMFKITSFGCNTFTERLAKISNDGRALFYCNLVPSSLQCCFELIHGGVSYSRAFFLKDRPHRIVYCVEIRLVLRPNFLTTKVEKKLFADCIIIDWANCFGVKFF